MNFKIRVKNIERKINLNSNGIQFEDLIKRGYRHSGKPFESTGRLFKAMMKMNRAFELPNYCTLDVILILYENKLLTGDSPEMQEVIKKAGEEMREQM